MIDQWLNFNPITLTQKNSKVVCKGDANPGDFVEYIGDDYLTFPHFDFTIIGVRKKAICHAVKLVSFDPDCIDYEWIQSHERDMSFQCRHGPEVAFYAESGYSRFHFCSPGMRAKNEETLINLEIGMKVHLRSMPRQSMGYRYFVPVLEIR